MAYIASVKRLIPMLEHPRAKVLVAVPKPVYAKSLLAAIQARIDEGTDEWAGASIFQLDGEVRMPNGAVLTILGLESLEDVELQAGRYWSYLLYGYQLDVHVQDKLLPQVRMPADYFGTIGWEQFEGWKDDPLDSQEQPRERE